jgi:hypothetical protein
MTPLEDALTSVPDTATREEAREAMGILQEEVERLRLDLTSERAINAELAAALDTARRIIEDRDAEINRLIKRGRQE